MQKNLYCKLQPIEKQRQRFFYFLKVMHTILHNRQSAIADRVAIHYHSIKWRSNGVGYWETHHKLCCLLTTALLFNACTMRPPLYNSWSQQTRALEKLAQHYRVQGTLSYHTPQMRHTLRFLCQRTPHYFRLQLYHLLGMRLLELEYLPRQGWRITGPARLQQDNGIGTLFYSRGKQQLPLHFLAHWIVGLPGARDRVQLNAQKRVSHLSHWSNGSVVHIAYLRYHEKYQLPLPAQLQLIFKNHCVKLNINRWELF